MTPITGPFSRSERMPWINGMTYRQWDMDKTWYRQRKPYNLPLSFTYRSQKVDHQHRWNSSGNPNAYADWDASNSTGVRFGTNFQTKAYALSELSSMFATCDTYARIRFNGKVKDSASLMLMYLERQQAMSMLTARLQQMSRFAKDLRQFRFKSALNQLTASQEADRKRIEKAFSSKRDRLKRSSKAFGDNFLEYHFGWSALVNDIFSAIGILQGGVPPSRVRASYTWDLNPYDQTYVSGTNRYTASHRITATTKCGADIYVSNPNLWLANQLGLVNPALWLYERVPFSFIANWFGTIEEFLSQFTEFWGLSVQDPFTTRVVKSSSKWAYRHNTSLVTYATGGNSNVQVSRTPGALPSVSLIVRKPWNLSPTRGLVAASLLMQRLSTSPRR